MKQFFQHLTAAVMAFCFCSQGHTSQIDIMSHSSDEPFAQSRSKWLVRHNTFGDLKRYDDGIQRMHHARKVMPILMQYPDIQAPLLHVTNYQEPRIVIYIPRHCEQDHQSCVGLPFDPTLDYSCIVSLAIYSSAGNTRGYWQSAVRSLIPFIQRLPNLMEVTLSQHVVEDVIETLPPERYINIDFNSYVDSDTFISTETLQECANVCLAYYQQKYRDFYFQLAPITNPLLSFALQDEGSFQG